MDDLAEKADDVFSVVEAIGLGHDAAALADVSRFRSITHARVAR